MHYVMTHVSNALQIKSKPMDAVRNCLNYQESVCCCITSVNCRKLIGE